MSGTEAALNPNSVISWLTSALVFMGFAYLGLYALSLYMRFRSNRTEDAHNAIISLANQLSSGIFQLWLFARPIMQLIIILFVASWFAHLMQISPEQFSNIIGGDIKTVLAFFVIGAFCLSAFLSNDPAGALKDAALVVIGFYFGSKS